MTKKVLIVSLLCLLVSGAAFSKDTTISILQNFVASVYQDYADESFEAVYSVMYPSVQKSVSEREYVQFQEHHFKRLRLELTDIVVGEVREDPRLPRILGSFLADDDELKVYGVDLSYRARFVSGVRLNQTVSKTVYIVLVDPGTSHESIFLLWDPTTIEEEGTDNDSH